MPHRLTPSNHGSSGIVTLPKDDLEYDGLVDEDNRVQGQNVRIERKGRGRWEVVVLDENLRPIDQRTVDSAD